MSVEDRFKQLIIDQPYLIDVALNLLIEQVSYLSDNQGENLIA